MRLINQVLNWWKAAVFLPMVVISVTLSEYGRWYLWSRRASFSNCGGRAIRNCWENANWTGAFPKSLFLTSNLLKLHAFHFPKTFYLNNCNHKVFFLLQNCLKGLYNLTTCYNVTTYVLKLSIVHESLQVHHHILNSVQFLSGPQSHLFSCESFKLW